MVVEQAGEFEMYYEGEVPTERAAALLQARWHKRKRPGLFLPAVEMEWYSVTGKVYEPVEHEMTAAEVDSWRAPLVRFLVEQYHPFSTVAPLLRSDHSRRQVHWVAIFADGLLVTLPLWLLLRPKCTGAIRRARDKGRLESLHAGRCPRCGYDTRYLPEPRCPECGLTWIVGEDDLPAL